MSSGDPDKPGMDHQTCNCPYCGSESIVFTTRKYIYSYPLEFRAYGIFHGIFLWNNHLPKDVEHMEIVCTCKRKFHIQCWPHNPFQEDEDNTAPIKISNEKLFLEELIEKTHGFIRGVCYGLIRVIQRLIGIMPPRASPYNGSDRIDKACCDESFAEMLILNASLVFSLFIFLMIIPATITGASGKLLNDRLLFVTPCLFILLLTSFQRQIGIIHESLLKFNSLPVLLHEKYPKWPDYQKFNDASIKRFFLGHPCKNKLKKAISPPYVDLDKWTQLTPPPIVFGIVAIIIGIVFYHYFIPPGGFAVLNYYIPCGGFTVTEVNTPDSNPIIYTSGLFNLGYLFFHIPFWFVIGTVVWLSLITPCFIYIIARNLPLRINPLKEIGGPEILGEILLKSNVSVALLALGFIAYVIRNESILKLDPTFEFFNIFLLSIFTIMIIFGFLLPLYPIHKKMKQCKEDEIDALTEKIDYEKIKNGMASPAEVNLNLLRVGIINKISSKREWPFNLDTFTKIILLTLIPLFELFMSLRSLI